VIRFNLEQAGFHVSTAANGREALELLQDEGYDLVITDHQMPGMTGWELYTHMRQAANHAQTPVIFLTAKMLEPELARLTRESAVAASFAKPFSPSELVCAVEEHLAPAPEPTHG
jgi:CheY-like chemotaxis protein